MRIAWAIAASDSSSGAGIQADLATFAHFKVHGCSIISKITAQNTQGITESYTLPGNIFQQQLITLDQDLSAEVIKISVLGSSEQLTFLTDFLNKYKGYTVYDPVLLSSTQTILTHSNLLSEIKKKLLPKLTLITPNIFEVEALTGIKITNYQDIICASQAILDMGVKNVLIKGGHFLTTHASDFFMNSQQYFWLVSPQQDLVQNVHGTGCHLSSAIAAQLALGFDLTDSIVIAKRYINSAIRNSYLPVSQSIQNYIPQFSFEFKATDMPRIVKDYSQIEKSNYPNNYLPCGKLGLYAIVNTSHWVAKLANYGVKTIQLRIKECSLKQLEQEIITSIALAKKHAIKLFINDYWELAIKHRAYGIHLGQEDLQTADMVAIRQHPIRLGISSHSHYELANALKYQPSYIALGPIFPTTSKVMPWAPQGLQRIKEWQSMLQCPLVVIGGIGLANIDAVLSAGAENIAMMSAITLANCPAAITALVLQKLKDKKPGTSSFNPNLT
ncbi:MAG: thiamine phosphate synthase [Burkholderiales bacterium]